MDAILKFANDYPALTGIVLTAVVWPVLSAFFNYFLRPVSAEESARLDIASPRWAGVLKLTRGLGLDPQKAATGAMQAITGKLKVAPSDPSKPGNDA